MRLDGPGLPRSGEEGKELGVGGKKIKKKKAPPQKAERKLAKRVDLFS